MHGFKRGQCSHTALRYIVVHYIIIIKMLYASRVIVLPSVKYSGRVETLITTWAGRDGVTKKIGTSVPKILGKFDPTFDLPPDILHPATSDND